MISQFFSKLLEIVPFPASDNIAPTEKLRQDFLRHEAQLGGQIFGPVPHNRTRQFFALDEKTMIWHETWKDENGIDHERTTRYEIRQDGVVKSQDGTVQYQKVTGEELQRLVKAAATYRDRVTTEIYDPILKHSAQNL
jgi:hypothetical protein